MKRYFAETTTRAGAVPDPVGMLLVPVVAALADASGTAGMAGGQALDLAAEGRNLGLADLEQIHALKTGALIRAAVRMGALCGSATDTDLAALDRFATALGLAFQVRDDILDVEGDSATLGKTAGKDAAQDKATFPALIGLEASKARLQQLAAEMADALAPFGAKADALAALGKMAIERQH